MSKLKTTAAKATLLALYYSRLGEALSPVTGGTGIIFMLHRVTEEPVRAFEPNSILKVTPAFLDETIGLVREAGIEIVSLDDAYRRLIQNDTRRRFACFTLDDGYRDNLEEAYPVFRRHKAPFTIFVTSDFADGKGDLWWLALERLIEESDDVAVDGPGLERRFSCPDVKGKHAAFSTIYWWLRAQSELDARAWVQARCRERSIDTQAIADELLMDWRELAQLSRDPLVTIGAHTRRHLALAGLPAEEARAEVASGMDRVEHMLGLRPVHFSFPYGCRTSATERDVAIVRSLGLRTAVTTRKGLLHPEHREHLHCLPRLSLNGAFQDKRYTASLITGSPFALANGLRRVVTA